MTHRIVVLGAGYAGLTAAIRCARTADRDDVEVVLVNRLDRFVERVRLHQLAAGQQLRDRPLAPLLGPATLTVARVTGIDLAGGKVELDSGPGLGYDTLIYALGSATDLDRVPGCREHALDVATPESALRVAQVLGAADGPRSVAVVGAGLTGIETATELAAAHPGLRVDLLTGGQLGDGLSVRAQRHLRRSLDRLGVHAVEGRRVTGVHAAGPELADGSRHAADATIWAAGFRVPSIAADAGLAVDEQGRVVVDERLRSSSHPEVYAVGDVAGARTGSGEIARMSCQSGLPMGWFVASDLARERRGRSPRPHVARFVEQNISLGRRDGIVQFTRLDDRPRPAVLTGRPAARVKEWVCRGAAWATHI